MAPLLAVVKPYGFVPVTGWDDDQRAKYPIGSTVHLSVLKGRSPKMHRFYWGLVDHVASAIGYDKDTLSDELLRSTGRIKSWVAKNGEIYVQPKRISEMGHAEFKDYFDAAIELICAEYIADMSPSDLLREIEAMLKITYSDAMATPNKRELRDAA